MQKIHSIGIALALTSVALAAHFDGFTLKRTPKEGEVTKYHLKADIEVAGQSATITATAQDKVTKVEADGTYTVESSQLDAKFNFGGQEQDVPSQAPEITVYAANGAVKEIRGDTVNEKSYRMANMNGFFTPDKAVNVGDTWTKEVAADAKTGAVAGKSEFKVVGEEKLGSFDTLKIQATYKETSGSDPASAEGTFWMDKVTATMVKMTGKYTNAPFPGAPTPLNATVTLTRDGI